MRDTLRRTLAAAALLASACFTVPGAARADAPAPSHFRYRGGPLIEHVKVVTLFWGPDWSSATTDVSYVNGFFTALFADGRFMENLAQYSAGRYQIGNGALTATLTDSSPVPDATQVTDTQIRKEILAQIQAGSLPAPDADTFYCVFTPPDELVVDGADTSMTKFRAYHSSMSDGHGHVFAYGVFPVYLTTDPRGAASMDRAELTMACSHEMGEAVTDPRPGTGWTDPKYGEIGDIVNTYYEIGSQRLVIDMLADVLVAPDSTPYWVQKMWSDKDQDAVAFAP